MTTYVTIPNSDVDQDSPVTVALMTALRDNPTAITEGASGSPVLGLTKIAKIDLSSDATADFTAVDATRYGGYKFELANVIPVTNAAVLYIRTSTDGGVGYDASAGNYKHAGTLCDQTGTVTGYGSSSSTRIECGTAVGSDADEHGISGTVTLNGPHLSKNTLVTGYGGHESDGTDSLDTFNFAGVRLSAADVDAVRFLFSTGSLESGTITMYGISL